MIERVRHFIFNRNGATDIDANGSGFAVDLDISIAVPPTATNCTVSCTHATIWNITPNIGPGLSNNKLRITGTIGIPVGNQIFPQAFDITLELGEGIYNIESFNDEVQRQWTSKLYEQYQLQHADTWFDFLPNESNGKVYIQATRFFASQSYDICIFRFDEPAAADLAAILGFTTVVALPRTGYVEAANVAKFNTVDGFVIISPELASRGIPINGRGVGCIARIPIFDASGGSILQYEPVEPIVMSGQHLVGQEITRVSIQLRNQVLQPIIMREDWSIIVAIRFYVPE